MLRSIQSRRPDTPATGAVLLSDTLTYTVRDNLGAISNVATVLVSLVNQLPTAKPDSAATTTGVPVVINVVANDTASAIAGQPVTINVLANDGDPIPRSTRQACPSWFRRPTARLP
jgi:hypothetical protein